MFTGLMTTHADLHFLSSTISAKFVATQLFGPNVLMNAHFDLIVKTKKAVRKHLSFPLI